MVTMRKIINLVVLFLLVLSLCSACSSINDPVQSENNYSSETVSYNHSKFLTEGFDEFARNNPIDLFYQPLEYTGDRNAYCAQLEAYLHSWEDETQNAYELLIQMISDSDRNILEQSQNGWMTYMSQELEWQKSIYKDFNYEPIGNDYWMAVLEHHVDLYRERALELIEYVYALSGKYEFKFPH